jgi:DNA-binding Lrp family transcriptional regulator
MAIKAFVLVEVAVGKTKDVLDAFKKLESVRSVDAVTGPYDVIAVVEAADLNAIGELITNQIHRVQGILRTVTCLSDLSIDGTS